MAGKGFPKNSPRIIAGKHRGARLLVPRGDDALRPGLARLRKSLFDVLSNHVDFDGLSVLDVFAGSGSFGLESVSRGATTLYLVEGNSATAGVLQRNVQPFEASAKIRVIEADFMALVPPNKDLGFVPDLIFFDPPFGGGFTLSASLEVLSRLAWLSSSCVIVWRGELGDADEGEADTLPELRVLKRWVIGRSWLCVCRYLG